MKSGILAALASLAILVAWPLPAATAGEATPRYTTISQQSAADPGFSKFGSLYYVYATGGGDGVLPIFSGSSTTSGFTKVGNAYPAAPAGLNKLWAPHVVKRDGQYFMFFTAAKGSGPHCVYWAVPATTTPTFGWPAASAAGSRSPVT